MGWSIGFDSNWNRDIGYGVKAYCDSPKCNKVIDRGLAYVCSGQPRGGERGCGLYFCSEHLFFHTFRDCPEEGPYCIRCCTYKDPYKPKPEHPDWIKWKMTDDSWAKWREEQKKAQLLAL
jgi:hypothetical protein